MSQLIDTHAHLYLKQFNEDAAETLGRAREGLSHIFLPNIDLDSISYMHSLVDSSDGFCYPMMGLHPCSVKEDWANVVMQIEDWFSTREYYGVGETGLDYYWDKTFVAEQKESLRIHCRWAKEKKLPLILHCRESMDDVIEIVSDEQDGSLRGIFHCFDGSSDQAEQIFGLGFMVGLGGIITYKRNEALREVISGMPMDSIVLETDSPYLPPEPHRGKRNESSYVALVAAKLAEIKGMSSEEVASVTSANALNMFGLG